MEKKFDLSDGSYWGSTHSGFDFSGNDWQIPSDESKLSAVMRNDKLNKLDLLRCGGLTEVVENASTEDFLPFNISQAKNEKLASQLAKNLNPLVISEKVPRGNIKNGPDEVIKNMILGLDCSLSEFKGKRQKIELLNAAVRSHDGNAILKVVLFMRDTLKKSIFQREIIQCLDAVNVYLAYLEEDHEADELTNMLLLLKRADDAAMIKYEAATHVQDLGTKLKWIDNCLITHFQTEGCGSFFHHSVAEHVQLLGEHMKLQVYGPSTPTNEAIKSQMLFERCTGKKSVIDSSVLYTLIFYCLNHQFGGEINVPGAEKIKQNFKISRKQYTWAVIKALAALERWIEIDFLFLSKSWMGGLKMQSCVRISRILEILHKAKSPNEVLRKYVSFVENEEEKLMLAKKYACHSVVIEVFKNNKDRVALKNYQAALLPNSVDFYTAKEALNNPAIRWKN